MTNHGLVDERPRERLLRRGPESLSDAELIEVLLGAGVAGAPARRIARRLLAEHGGLSGLARLEASAWLRARGVGEARAARLLAALELAHRLAGAGPPRGARVSSPADVAAWLRARLRHERREVFVVLLLDGRHRLLDAVRVSVGTLTSSLVHPREVFAPAIAARAAAVVAAHNHPSGDPEPSIEDLQVTRRLEEVGRLVGIRLLDHVVVGDPGFVSLRERGYVDGTDERR